MLAPKKLKMRKPHRPDIKGKAARNTEIAFGQFAIKAMTGGWIKAQQIEAARRVISRYTRKGGKLWIRIFPHRPITGKGTQATMGSGKGAPEYYVAAVLPGNIIFELGGLEKEEAKKALELSGHKLPIKVKFIEK